jgi:hypothetical protein
LIDASAPPQPPRRPHQHLPIRRIGQIYKPISPHANQGNRSIHCSTSNAIHRKISINTGDRHSTSTTPRLGDSNCFGLEISAHKPAPTAGRPGYIIDSNTAVDLNLPHTSAPNSLKVTVANGDQISNVGIYNNLPVQIDTESFIIDCYNIKLGGYDFVLGVQLVKLARTDYLDFNNLTMKFWRNRR